MKPSEEEMAFGRRMSRHLETSLKALSIPLVLSGIVLVNGNYLSELINTDPNSIPFRLWPFNRVYLQQFSLSTYSSSEIRWFFTVVSCANLIWLTFLCWKLFFEFFRGDVEFPSGKTPVITQVIVRTIIACCVLIGLVILVGRAGFNTQDDTFLGPSFKQSITIGAIKVVFALMFFGYVGVVFVLEFGGLGLRYLFSKAFGYSATETSE